MTARDHVNEITTIKQIYAALNSFDIEGFLAFMDDDIVRVETEEFPTPGTYRGLEEIKAHVIKGRSTWAEGGCDPQKFSVVNNRIVVLVHVLVRLKDKTEWIDGHIADVFTFKNTKVIEMRSFINADSAIKWADAN